MSPFVRVSRRSFLQSSAAAFAFVQMPLAVQAQSEPVPSLESYKPEYFTAPEWTFILAATARLIPSDGDGPGAIEARVPVFLDRQLAGEYGAAADWYMQGPHDAAAAPQFGYQTPLTPAEIYRTGIEGFNAWCEATHGARFAELPPADQDAALSALENNTGADGAAILPPEESDFFALLWKNTREGYFADPKYGGNHAMAAWVYIGFPGARASFTEWVTQHDVPYPLGPVSISGERA
jgi:gluconate 2-dehydrogenase gamma chain